MDHKQFQNWVSVSDSKVFHLISMTYVIIWLLVASAQAIDPRYSRLPAL